MDVDAFLFILIEWIIVLFQNRQLVTVITFNASRMCVLLVIWHFMWKIHKNVSVL